MKLELTVVVVVAVVSDSRSISTGIDKWDKNLTKDILKEIETHWRPQIPEETFDENSSKEKLYILSMFPYPSGQLHLGHVRVYGTGDVLARYYRMKGKNVLHPIGWDAFGLPAENAALERGVDPREWTRTNIGDMKAVLKELNLSFDWDREFATCDPEYYKWTQYLFVKLFEKGLVYRKEALVNWDPVDGTVLADEQVDINGRSWRSGALVEKKPLKQWFIKTTEFAQSLMEGLENPELEGWNDVIDIQKHWIGDVNGTVIEFEIEGRTDRMPIWMKNPEFINKGKFVAVKRNSYWTIGTHEKDLMPFKVKNPFNGQLLPVYQTDSPLFPEGAEVHLGVPEVSELDKEFADSFDVKYTIGEPLPEEESRKLKEKVCAEARSRGIGGHPASSKLRDWLISRQRYWGTPIPIVHCDKCGAQPVPVEDLPVRLPEIGSIEKGANPLEKQTEWIQTNCPKCGGPGRRETDTMDTFVDSSWYYFRFVDPRNEKAVFDSEKAKKYTPVDIYVGGKEHAVLHLFYARFVNHFLNKLGLVPHKEPFTRFLSQAVVKGLTYKLPKTGEYVDKSLVVTKDKSHFHANTNEPLIEEWEKMSKSKHNSVEPKELIAENGVDMTRIIILGASSPRSEINWNYDFSNDVFQWQKRLWLTVSNFIRLRSQNTEKPQPTEEFKNAEYYIFDSRNYYLKTITSVMEELNDIGSCLRKMWGLTGSIRKSKEDIVAHSLQYERALALQIILLAPLAPCFASELWAGFLKAPNRLCHTGEILWNESVFRQPWPQIDPEYQPIRNQVAHTSENVILSNIIKKQDKRKEKFKQKKNKKKAVSS